MTDPPSPGWTDFISDSQVLRCGLAISASSPFDAQMARQLAQTLCDRIDRLTAEVTKVAVRLGVKAEEIEVTPDVRIDCAETIVVHLATYSFPYRGRRITIVLTATICQQQTNSKIWIKVPDFAEGDWADASEQLAREMVRDAAFEFYTRCALEVVDNITFDKVFLFEIRGAYSTDTAITDAFHVLQRSPDPRKAFEELRVRRKLFPIARLFKFAKEADAFDDEQQLERMWLAANVTNEETAVEGEEFSLVTPLSIPDNDAIVLIEGSRDVASLSAWGLPEDASVVRAWGLCHSDRLDFDESPPVFDAPKRLTAKLATLLAANT